MTYFYIINYGFFLNNRLSFIRLKIIRMKMIRMKMILKMSVKNQKVVCLLIHTLFKHVVKNIVKNIQMKMLISRNSQRDLLRDGRYFYKRLKLKL
jgi:hypothetical protein